MRIKSIRVTQLDLYNSCPCCFLYSITGVKQSFNPNLNLGTLVHKGIEEYHRFGKQVFSTETAPFLKTYIQSYKQKFTEIEYKFEIPLFDTGIQLTGTMDMINDNWIFEHKTSKSRWTQKQADEHKQVTAYSYAYKKVFNKDPFGIRFNILVKNKTPILQQLDTYRDNQDYEIWQEWIQKILENIKNDQFQPNYAARYHNFTICPGSLKL